MVGKNLGGTFAWWVTVVGSVLLLVGGTVHTITGATYIAGIFLVLIGGLLMCFGIFLATRIMPLPPPRIGRGGF